jgi:uncharacterized repeat protein (TIGR03803 family)
MKTAVILLLCVATTIASPAQTFTSLFSFDGTDGAGPGSGLVQGTDGGLYGTITGGLLNGHGTIFEITGAGMLTTLYRFCTQSPCLDGSRPEAALVLDTDGNIYGTTAFGGTHGDGTLFKITADGTLTTLYNFCSLINAQGYCVDGTRPDVALVRGTDGNLYGVTYQGGANRGGTIFKFTTAGSLTTLYSFCSRSSCADGKYPSGLLQASNGSFYGTTTRGGAGANGDGNGTVFQMTPDGTLTTLHIFNGTDGLEPSGALVQDAAGNFYGTTLFGGLSPTNGGTAFKITANGAFTSVHSFCTQPSCPDGLIPNGLIQGTDGNFFGTTEEGGGNRDGTVFKMSAAGKVTALYDFCTQAGCVDGSFPAAALMQSTNGTFYGTTSAGGASGDGTIFSLATGLGPFVALQPTLGSVGARVIILGTNLGGATNVSFNGTAATFSGSNSAIETTVPVGATTGTVSVTTPSGTLSSNVVFHVRP